MIATNQLRWVKRRLNYNPTTGEVFSYYADVCILQQKWVGEKFDAADYSKVFGKYTEEWRDVPVEEETK